MNGIDPILFSAIGLIAGAIAIARWIVLRRRVDAEVRRLLQDGDPANRLSVIRLLGSTGAVGRYTGALMWRVTVESDPEVHAALASLAASDAWVGSPSTDRTEFHLWGVAEMLRLSTAARAARSMNQPSSQHP